MSKIKNLYLDSAHLYDACIKQIYSDFDIPFYLSYAKPNMNILEIACGTGRITIPLAKMGAHVTSLDLSKPMLQVLQTKLKFEPVEVRNRIQYVESDMTDFYLEKEFDLILVPLYSFHTLTTDHERLQALSCIKNQTNKNSILIISMFDPKDNRLKLGSIVDLEFFDEDLNCTIKRHTVIDGHASAKQIIHSHYKFELLKDDKICDTRTEYLELGYLYKEQADNLFIRAGFTIIESFGGYDKTPIDPEQKRDLIYVLQKK